jgi:superfamily II DNA or RNA helicase
VNLSDLDLKSVYYSDEDNLLEDFYIPVLSNSSIYSRVAGYFCSNSFAIAAKGVANFIANGGRIRLIANVILSTDDQTAIKGALEQKQKEVLEEIDNLEDQLKKDHIRMLAWMIRNKSLDIKIAVIKKGIEHQKVGILEDEAGNMISFSGSDNETVYGWVHNDEQFHVFCSWKQGDTHHLSPEIERFERLWQDRGRKVRVYNISDAFRRGFIKNAPKDSEEFKTLSMKASQELLVEYSLYYKAVDKGKSISLRDYQKGAIASWLDNNFTGIFEMATGSGKTYTALGCVNEILKENRQLLIVIACPYTHLLKQWTDNIERYGFHFKIVTADSSNYKWKTELTDITYDIKNKILDKLIILTTHATFSSDDFVQIIRNIRLPSFLICDEVHGIGAPERQKGLLSSFYDYRVGLSATPSRWFDDIGTQAIFNYFDKVVFEFSLKDAINTINPDTGNSYLVRYDYFPIFVELTDVELAKYEEQTLKLAKSFFSAKSDKDKNELFNLLCIRRQKTVTNAEKKYEALRNLLLDKEELSDCLVYCSPEQIDKVQSLIGEFNIKQHKFTAEEGIKPVPEYGGLSEREHLLRLFEEGKYKVLVAMKCLDQGVDVRTASIAIFMASSTNPMEYIQRRGRILRPYPGKRKAIIFDLIVIPAIRNLHVKELFDLEKRILEKEMIRYNEFADAADNRLECIEKIVALYTKLGV